MKWLRKWWLWANECENWLDAESAGPGIVNAVALPVAIVFMAAVMFFLAGCNTVRVTVPAGAGPVTINVTQSRSVPVEVARGARASGLP